MLEMTCNVSLLAHWGQQTIKPAQSAKDFLFFPEYFSCEDLIV